MGLDIYLTWPERVTKDPDYVSRDEHMDSKKHPDHLFKRDYLRSSYNDSGFNSAVGALIGDDLYSIFAPVGANLDEYDLRPTDKQLLECRKNAIRTLNKLRKAPALGATFERAVSLRPQDGIIVNDEQAIATYLKETNRDKDPFGEGGGWSNAKGVFYPTEPLEVHAIMPGKGILGDTGVWIVYKKDLDWYIQACEIVVEFIEEALSHPERTMTWSG